MFITRVLFSSVMSAGLCFSNIACGQTAPVSPNSSEVSTNDTSQPATDSAANIPASRESNASESKSESRKQDTGEQGIETGTEQTYAGETQPDPSSTGRSTPIQLAQRRFDDGCINLLAYDPEDTYVNVRDQPNGNIVRSLPNFALIQSADGPIGITEGWNEVLISMTQSKGYIHSDLISRTTYEVLDPNDTSANLRSAPDSEVITALANGTVVRFLSRKGDWTQVETQAGDIGYIASTLLAPPSCY